MTKAFNVTAAAQRMEGKMKSKMGDSKPAQHTRLNNCEGGLERERGEEGGREGGQERST